MMRGTQGNQKRVENNLRGEALVRFDQAHADWRLAIHSGQVPVVGRAREEGRHGLARRAGEALPSDRVLHPIGWHGHEPGSIWVAKKGQSLTALDSHLGGQGSASFGKRHATSRQGY